MRLLRLLVFLLSVTLYEEEVDCGRSYYYYNPYYQTYRKKYLTRMRGYNPKKYMANYQIQRDHKEVNRGPNVCAVKEVFGTGERFYEASVRPKRICDRSTFTRYMCCPGFKEVEGEKGCPAMKPLENLKQTALGLNLHKFARLLTNTELEGNLLYQGAFTVFVPINKAFHNLPYDDRQRLHPWTYNAPSLLHYHVVTGRHNFTTFKKHQEIPTLYYAEKKIRVNKYPHGVATVNCAKILIPNIVASNGIIHVIDKLIKPLDFIGNLADVLLRDPKFSMFAQVLYKANIIAQLQNEKYFTIFAPTNAAFRRLSREMKEELRLDRKVAEAVANYHIVRDIHCSSSTVVAKHLQSLEGGFLRFLCRYNGNYVNSAKLIEEDIIADNGVIHRINKVLLPASVKDILDIAHELDLNTLLYLTRKAGLADWLENREEFTWFAPSDKAFQELSPIYREALIDQPGLMEHLLRYHTVEGLIKTDSLVGDQTLNTGIAANLKINVYQNGILVDAAHIINGDKIGSNGVIHVIDKVLIPPEMLIMDLLLADTDLSSLARAVIKAGLEKELRVPDKQFTLIAPTNDAFYWMANHMKKRFMNDPEQLKRLINKHIIDRMVISRGLQVSSTYTLPSRQGEEVIFKLDSADTLWVSKYSKAVDKDMMALNGVVFKVDRVLHCACNNVTNT